jgi:nucleotide-binding universal stress UspA family protein
MYETIVVPTDGSEYAKRAATHAASVATAFDATVHVLSVVDEDAASGVFQQSGVDEETLERLRAESDRAVESTCAELDEEIPVETAVVEGHAAESIVSYAEDVDANLLVMGTHGRTGVDRYVAGSVTERVLRRTHVPVLTVRDVEAVLALEDYEDVMVPTDGSEDAGVAVEHALALAAVGGATVHAVNVVDVGSLAASAGEAPVTGMLERFEEAGEEATGDVAEQARAAGLAAETAVLKGSPGHALLEYADEQDVDMITMGTTGRTGLDRYLLGSTAERVVRHADAPVLAVNARTEQE